MKTQKQGKIKRTFREIIKSSNIWNMAHKFEKLCFGFCVSAVVTMIFAGIGSGMMMSHEVKKIESTPEFQSYKESAYQQIEQDLADGKITKQESEVEKTKVNHNSFFETEEGQPFEKNYAKSLYFMVPPAVLCGLAGMTLAMKKISDKAEEKVYEWNCEENSIN